MPQGYGDVHRLKPPEADSHGCGRFADPEAVAHLRDSRDELGRHQRTHRGAAVPGAGEGHHPKTQNRPDAG